MFSVKSAATFALRAPKTDSASRAANDEPSSKPLRLEPVVNMRPGTHTELFARGEPTIAQAIDPLDGMREKFPAAGETFHGFKLISLIGVGGFARVYLAHQENLADRPVALKITALPNREPQRLARLQHQNIMPIHSVHYARPFQAVCMPYLGSATLADVARSVFKGHRPPASGQSIFETEHAEGTVLEGESLPVPEPLPELSPNAHTLRADLLKLGYVEAVLSIVSRVCDGLDHAHCKGIVHRDLKPANILLAADGQPMLLDFNLALDRTSDDPVEMGGTLPYMSPEQLRDLNFRGSETIGPASDLYSLGLILYELLAGRSPYPTFVQDGRKHGYDVAAMEAERRGPFQPASKFNPDVPPSVDAILAKLLAFEPERRYRNALSLKEDIDRQLLSQSLKYAKETSGARFRKWRRRHPKLLPWSLGLGAFAALGIAGFAYERETHARRRLDAQNFYTLSLASLDKQRLDLNFSTCEEKKAAAADVATRLLDEYGALSDPNWKSRPAFRMLAPENQKELGDRLGESLLLLAQRDKLAGDPDSLRKALELNGKAEFCFSGERMPGFGWKQRIELAEMLSRPELVPAARERLALPEPCVDSDALLRGMEFYGQMRYEEALKEFSLFADRNPRRFEGHYLVALCQQQLRLYDLALERYALARAISPMDERVPVNRAAVYHAQGRYRQASDDIAIALAIKGDSAPLHLLQANVHYAQRRFDDCLEEAAAAAKLGATPVEVAYLRHKVYQRTGRREAAEETLAELNAATPGSAIEFVLRGNARQLNDADGAVSDYKEAIKRNPRCIEAYHNLATIQVSKQKDLEQGIATLRKVLEIAPGYQVSRCSLAVFLARAGHRVDAHTQAHEAIRGTRNSFVVYQAAGAYALTAKDHPEDGVEAIRLLGKAISMGFMDAQTMKADKDLDNLRSLPEFTQMQDSLTLLRKWTDVK